MLWINDQKLWILIEEKNVDPAMLEKRSPQFVKYLFSEFKKINLFIYGFLFLWFFIQIIKV